ncbi:serine hydrolase domain-containing protein [Austwickia chelonae]|uniref:serine hydrolase domain-containing protein n=1 Tax=Austwickia chelonae TaxID=100225 RepID=UPI0013C32154|nr:serine hydrolase domain-containing protein [Austwickia chelonae]
MNFCKKRRAYVMVKSGELVKSSYGKNYRADFFVEWGSVTKLVTAHLIARLVEEGFLDWGTPACELVEVLPSRVTVHSLVTHSSGLPRVHPGMSSGVFSDPYKGADEAFIMQALRQIDEDSLDSVGSVEYSNLGYAVLALLVERATGRSWFDAARGFVLEPAGLGDVSTLPPTEMRAHINGFDGRPHQPWDLGSSPYVAAGGLWSDLQTMANYGAAAMEKGLFMAAESGWQRRRDVYWHNGQTRDSGAFLALIPECDVVVASHTLAGLPGAADRLGWELVEGWPGGQPAHS